MTPHIDEAAQFLVLGGRLNNPRDVIAICMAHGRRNDTNWLDRMVELAKVKFTDAGLPGDGSFLNLSYKGLEEVEDITEEDAWIRLLELASEMKSPGLIAKVRLAMIENMGEDKQKQIVGQWNDQKRGR